jgi:ATP-dependent 26S proteasome regulatory subunit
MPFGRRIDPDEFAAATSKLVHTEPETARKNSQEPSDREQELKTDERFEARPPKFKMTDLVLSQSVLTELRTLKSRISNHGVIYETWDFRRIDPSGRNAAVNLYGPPGTGKTMCAEALADDFGKMLIEVNYAEIESKYVGETPKNIVAAFRRAKACDALLFFDEADSILGRRMTNVTQSADHAVNVARAVMLKQLDEFSGIVVFATNLAKNFDGAFVRRILQHICIAAPDEDCRRRLWERMITPSVPGRESLDFGYLAKVSDGMTGGSIKNAVLLALSNAADRTGRERKVDAKDLESAIENIKRAQRDVGISQSDW